MTEETELTEVQNTQVTVPDFMKDSVDHSAGAMTEFIRPNRIRCLQSLSDLVKERHYHAGDIIALPLKQMIAPVKLNEQGAPTKTGEPFHIVPIYFYPEYITWNPRGSKKAIRERTTDPNSEIAKKARNPETREETIDSEKVKHQEHLNFIVMVIDAPGFENMAMSLSYSKSEWLTGSNLCTLIRSRQAPSYGCIFKAQANMRTNSEGEWYGIDVSNPDSNQSAFVENKEQFEAYEKLHDQFHKAYEKGLIDIGHDEEPAPSQEREGDIPF